MKLSNKVALITGTGSGIGQDIALLFVKEGATVVGVGRRMERLEATGAMCKGPGRYQPMAFDLYNKEANFEMVEATVRDFGKIDILVNNAARIDNMAGAAQIPDDIWEATLFLNLSAPLYAVKAALKYMLPAKSGNIINITTVAGTNGCRGGVAYTASKTGLHGLTQNTAFMYGSNGIRCNAIALGMSESTEIGETSGITKIDDYGMERTNMARHLNMRYAKKGEFAPLALFLASDDSSMVNGAILVADSGWTAY